MRFLAVFLPSVTALCLVFGIGWTVVHHDPGFGLPFVFVGAVALIFAIIVNVRIRKATRR